MPGSGGVPRNAICCPQCSGLPHRSKIARTSERRVIASELEAIAAPVLGTSWEFGRASNESDVSHAAPPA